MTQATNNKTEPNCLWDKMPNFIRWPFVLFLATYFGSVPVIILWRFFHEN